ncbi:hypothetical protein BT96DRAFT_1025333 [Gymnopus androsaceus JB14]|uniref:Uncharacterized protein n=1 Tax=Gymnopus androsaceus JB14 TaxID=1447944 RepID=A0A6A4GSD8_9AGAR|nr:hypothetical protein BT96DRAFT_1025333 [Gymnopus androsaceus JB14]
MSHSSNRQHTHCRSSNRGSSPPTSDPPQSSSLLTSPTRDLLAVQKHRIEALEDKNTKLKNKKQKKNVTMSTLGRPIHWLVSLFTSPNTLLAEHDRRCDPAEEEDDLSNVHIEALNPIQQEEYEKRIKDKCIRDCNYESFNLLLKHVPQLKERIYKDHATHLELQSEFKELVKGGSGARGEDFCHGAKEIADWLNSRNPAPIPRLNCNQRTGRGTLTEKIHSAVRIDLQLNRISYVKHSLLPFFLRFLYHNKTGDAANPLKGWLQGPLLVKMMMIFKSASAVGDEKLSKELDDSDDENINPDPESESLSNQPMSTKLRKSTWENVAKIYGLTTVSPRMIAYSAVAVQFTLSGVSTWGTDRSFPYESFYNAIIDFFEDAEPGSDEDEQNKKLLAWWNTTIFSSTDAADNCGQSLKDFQNILKNLNGQRHAAKAAHSTNACQPNASDSNPSPAASSNLPPSNPSPVASSNPSSIGTA